MSHADDRLLGPRVVRYHRKRLGLTIEALAEAAKVSLRTVKYAEAWPTHRPRLATLRALAGVLGIPVSYLTGARWEME